MIDMPERSYCGHCGYPLVGSDEPRCGGCGRSFNPLDPTTFSKSPDGRLSVPWRVAIWSMIYPLLPCGMLLVTYSLAHRSLGGTPQPGSDDPRSLVGALRVCGDITLVLIRAIPVAMAVGILAVCAIPYSSAPGRRLREIAAGSMLLLMVWSGWFGCAALPMRPMFAWFFG